MGRSTERELKLFLSRLMTPLLLTLVSGLSGGFGREDGLDGVGLDGADDGGATRDGDDLGGATLAGADREGEGDRTGGRSTVRLLPAPLRDSGRVGATLARFVFPRFSGILRSADGVLTTDRLDPLGPDPRSVKEELARPTALRLPTLKLRMRSEVIVRSWLRVVERFRKLSGSPPRTLLEKLSGTWFSATWLILVRPKSPSLTTVSPGREMLLMIVVLLTIVVLFQLFRGYHPTYPPEW